MLYKKTVLLFADGRPPPESLDHLLQADTTAGTAQAQCAGIIDIALIRRVTGTGFSGDGAAAVIGAVRGDACTKGAFGIAVFVHLRVQPQLPELGERVKNKLTVWLV